MKLRFALIIIIYLTSTAIATLKADTKSQADTVALTGNWVNQLWQTGFHINDPRISYPRFPKFCLKVYNWGDRVFNHYDPAYVRSTGKNWKLTLDATGSMQSYGYLFDLPGQKTGEGKIRVRSNIGYDAGVHLSFMAVSIGYTWNMNKLTGHNDSPRSTFNFSFTCARFSAELLSQKTQGNTVIEKFGHYNEGKRVNIPLDNTRRNTFLINAFYFLNHSRYSQAAAYCFSKYQLRSAGSWLVGFNFHNFTAQAGYAYNAVMPHNWLFNITLLPGAGYRRSLIKADKRPLQEMLSAGLDGRMSVVYNHRALFLNLTVKANASFLFNSDYSFFMSSEQATFIFGVRF